MACRKSRWRGTRGLNRCSIGIKLDNPGKLTRQGDQCRYWFGKSYDTAEVMEAAHKHGGPVTGWHLYPEPQIAAAINVAQTIVHLYGLVDVLGYDDIAPGRKSDPGPVFPMASFCSEVLGREQDDEEFYETTTALNIRSGPGEAYEKIQPKPLTLGTRQILQSSEGRWCYVAVLDESHNVTANGWVHRDYIRRI